MRLRTLRQFFAFLVAEGYLAENPAARVEKLGTAEVLLVAITDHQVRRILAVPDRKTFAGLRDYTITVLLVDTGLSEVIGIHLGDVNFPEGHIKVLGKGARERVVPVQGKLKKALKQYLAQRGNYVEHDPLHFCRRPFNTMTKRNIQDRIEKAAIKAEVTNIRTSPHIWRHTFARLYILNGGDPFGLKQILGHQSSEMVHHYVTVFGSELKSQHLKASPLQNSSDDS